eukprot:jgi/Mesvir1/14670/Mv05336-RA.1
MTVHPLPSRWPDAETERPSTTQAFIRDYFEGRIRGEPPPPHRAVGKNSCSIADFKQAPQQAVVNMYLRYVARHGSQHRGFLAWHSTGSGKTCTALGAIDAFWDTDRPIYLATSRENASNNSIEEYGKCAALFPRFGGMTPAQATTAIRSRVGKGKILSFPQLAHETGAHRPNRHADPDLLRDAVLIMDEVQNLFRPLPGQAGEHDALRGLLDKPSKRTQGLYMVILSGTPGDTEQEISWLLSMIKGSRVGPDSPLSAYAGLCSYVDYAGDASVYPARKPDAVHITEPSAEQRAALRKRLSTAKDTPSQSERFLYEPRRVTNGLKMSHLSGARLLQSLPKLSPKMKEIALTISKHPNEKHYLYSAFNAGGIRDVARVLDALGYAPLPMSGALPTTAHKRYVLLGSDSNPTTDAGLRRIRQVFNAPDNADGRILQIILARKRFNEGLDLKSVRHIHIMEPLLSVNAERQTIARAVRHCSHLQVDKKKWDVTVHRYLTRDGVDDRVKKEAEKRDRDEAVSRMLSNLRITAIDCRLMSRLHNQKEWMRAGDREPIACMPTRAEEMTRAVVSGAKTAGRAAVAGAGAMARIGKRAVFAAGRNMMSNARVFARDGRAAAKKAETAYRMLKTPLGQLVYDPVFNRKR